MKCYCKKSEKLLQINWNVIAKKIAITRVFVNNNFWPFLAIITFLAITWLKCRFDAWCDAFTKKKSFCISSKWRLVWHLSKLETLAVRVQRYDTPRNAPHEKISKSHFIKYLCTRTVKVSNFDKCQTRRHFEEIKKDFFFVNASHHASNRHLSQVIAKKVII